MHGVHLHPKQAFPFKQLTARMSMIRYNVCFPKVELKKLKNERKYIKKGSKK